MFEIRQNIFFQRASKTCAASAEVEIFRKEMIGSVCALFCT